MAATIQTIQKPTRARALDTSGNNNHGQIYSGRALEFDGLTDYLDLGAQKTYVDYSAETTQANRAWTVACWIYLEANVLGTTPDHIIGGGGISAGYCCVYQGTNKLAIWDIDADGAGGSPNGAWRQGNTALEIKTWYRALWVFDGDETVTMYLNGVADGSGRIDTQTDNGDLSMRYIGAITVDSDPSVARLWNGKLADLQLWQGAFTADDALYDYNNPESLALNRGGTSLTNSNLKAWYPMNDGHRGQQSYILDASNTGLGDEKWDSDKQSGNLSGWVAYGSNEMVLDGDAIKVTYVNNTGGAYLYLRDALTLDSDLTVGQTYKMTVDAKMDGTAAQITYDRTGSGDLVNFGNLTTEWNTYELYFTAKHATNSDLRFNNLNVGEIGYVKNFSLKAINAKNHATTVFYGDEMHTQGNAASITNEADATTGWTNSGMGTFESSNAAADNGSYSMKFVVNGNGDKASINWTTVVGRTYLLTLRRAITNHAAAKRIEFKIGESVSGTENGEVDSWASNQTTSWCSESITFVASATTTYLTVQEAGDDNDAEIYVDTLSLKEVGTASGWTDADQQLDIPQTALQSYNQLAWFGQYNETVVIDDTTNDNDDIFAGGGSVSAWIFPYDIGENDYGRIANKSSGTGGEDGWGLMLKNESGSTSNIQFSRGHSTTDGKWQWDDEYIKYGTWNHVVVTYNQASASNNPTLYLNGESITISETSAPAGSPETDADQVLTIGNLSGSTIRTFAGCITEVSLWSTQLNQTQVNKLYNDGKAFDATDTFFNQTNLKGYWRNNGLATWTDLRGNGNNGTVNNCTETMLITAGVDGSRDSQGFLMNRQRTTNSLNLYDDMADGAGGTGSYMAALQSPFTADTDYNAMTVTLWFKTPDNTIRDSLFSIIHDNGTHFTVDTLGTGKFAWTYEGSTAVTDARYKTDADMYSNDKWTFVAFALDHDIGADVNRVKCYVGDEDTAVSLRTSDTTHSTVTTSPSKDNSLQIGYTEVNTNNFTGQVDDVFVYDKTLTLEEIKRNYNAGKRSHK